MKKMISVFALVTVLIASFSTEAFAGNVVDEQQNQSTLPKVRYYYTDSQNDVAMTGDADEFHENMEEDNQIEVVFELDYDREDCDCRKSINAESTDEEVDAVKMHHRQEMKEKHTQENEEFLADNGFSTESDEYTVTMSEYSPFVQVVFDNYNDFQNYEASIIGVAEDDAVLGVNIGLPFSEQTNATRVDSSDAPSYPMLVALMHIDALSQTYDGTGITVGIIEAEGVAYSSSHSELNSLSIHVNGSTTSPHAIAVTRLLCGSNGVARNVDEVYIYHAPNTNYTINSLDWMMENGVDVINQSMSIDDFNGIYHWTSAILDFYVRYNIVTFVNSAGNDGDTSNSDTNSFGMGYNVIAVGATDAYNNSSTYSSFGVGDDIDSRKPTISAPGTNIVIGGDSLIPGTSFSAPIVTGVIAKLMDEFSFLKFYPEVVIASLIASATPVNGQSGAWDRHAGAGRINYTRAREAVENYVDFEITNDAVGSIRAAQALSGVANKTIRVAAFWLVNSTTETANDQILVNHHTDYDLLIADSNGEYITGSMHWSNIEIINYSCGSRNNIILQIEQYAARITSDDEWGAFTWVYD